LVVRVNGSATPGSTIFNYATIESDRTPPTTVTNQPPDSTEPGSPVLPYRPAALDIKPRSCPNPINFKDRGVLPVALLGYMYFDVNQVDVGSLRLGGVAPLRFAFEDVATPFEPLMDKKDCTTDGPDGFLDLTLKFDVQQVVKALGTIKNRECRVLKLTGYLLDGTPIKGEDIVILLK
jgi:hypothetical protein